MFREELSNRSFSEEQNHADIFTALQSMQNEGEKDENPSPSRFRGCCWPLGLILDNSFCNSPRSSTRSSKSNHTSTLIKHSQGRRHYFDNSVTVTGNSVWYNTYVRIEPLPPGVTTTRNEQVVKTEFYHILSNIYLIKPKKLAVPLFASCLAPRMNPVLVTVFLLLRPKKFWTNIQIPSIRNIVVMILNHLRIKVVVTVALIDYATLSVIR